LQLVSKAGKSSPKSNKRMATERLINSPKQAQ
jgi:hypothetical protein